MYKITSKIFLGLIIIAFYTVTAVSCVQKSDVNNDNSSNEYLFSELSHKDIGAVTKESSITSEEETITIIAGGADIWGSHDEFHFVYKKIEGDFNVSVQIQSLSKAHQYTKAGIMARADLSDSSQHVYFQIFPDNTPRNKNNGGCEFQYRLAAGENMKAIYPDQETAGDKFNVNFPDTWIRMKRQGDVFESYFSKDNEIWNLYSSFSLEMPEELLIGLAITSHNSEESTTAVFSSLFIN